MADPSITASISQRSDGGCGSKDPQHFLCANRTAAISFFGLLHSYPPKLDALR